MVIALEEARIAGERGDLPIGAVIVHEDKIISKGANRVYTTRSSLSHAEISALHQCASFLHEHGRESIIYSTLEPCIMCLSTIIQANIRNIVFAMEDNYLRLIETWRWFRYLVRGFSFTRGNPAAEKAAELPFSRQIPGGDFLGFLADQYWTYYTGAIMALLIQAGFGDDPRIDRGFGWLLLMRRDDGGWTVPILTYKLDRANLYRVGESATAY